MSYQLAVAIAQFYNHYQLRICPLASSTLADIT